VDQSNGTWCRELTCSECRNAWFAPTAPGRYPSLCPTCQDTPRALSEHGSLLRGHADEVCDRAASVRPTVDRQALVRAVTYAGNAKGVPAQYDSLLNVAAVALALASRTPTTTRPTHKDCAAA
jgi:hypothetical protein